MLMHFVSNTEKLYFQLLVSLVNVFNEGRQSRLNCGKNETILLSQKKSFTVVGYIRNAFFNIPSEYCCPETK